VYALKIPVTLPIVDGGTPKPEQTPETVVFDDVTNG
jgi:hypothetical protein